MTLNGGTEDVVFIVLHGKAFNDDASWQRRANASAALSAAGVSSTTSYTDMIDHHLNSDEASATYVAGSAQVYRVDSYVPSFGASTSDHYPVLSRYTFGGGTPPPPVGTATVVINEILANEPGTNTAGEFVELVNVGTADAAIGGWTVSDATGVRHTFAAGTTLAPGKAVVVFGGAPAIPAGLASAVAASTGTLWLGNSGDSVILKRGATTVKSFAYPSSLSGTDGVSMNRGPDASATGSFVLHTTLSTLASSAGKRVTGVAH